MSSQVASADTAAARTDGGTGGSDGGRDGVRLTVLVDNVRGGEGLRSQWGLSFWVETPHARLLLDCGATDAFLRNAQALDVPLETADVFILSHGHYDHGGALDRVTAALSRARLVLHPGALVPRYSLRKTGKPERIGLPDRSLAALRAVPERIAWVIEPAMIAPRCWVSGPVPRREPLEEVERTFHLDRACTVRDYVVDDQAVWVETAGGLIILFGCAHAGVMNTVRYVRELAAATGARASAASGAARAVDEVATSEGTARRAADGVPIAADGLPRVRAVLGGMHLLHAGKERLEATAAVFSDLDLELCGPCHCTGKRATDLLRRRLPGAFAEVRTGVRFALP